MSGAPQLALRVEGLGFAYGQTPVLRDVTLPRQARGVVGLLGPNGSGKSTLLRCVAGHLRHSGSVSVHDGGRPLTPSQLSAALGYVPQDAPGDVALTVLETVLIGLRRRGGWRTSPEEAARAVECLAELGVDHLADRFLGQLSGGQRQLVGLAQMTVRAPKLMLLDEPTSALDLRHQIRVLEYVTDRIRAREGTALLALHDLNLAARFCDELVILRDGRCAAMGPPAEILTPEVLESTYGVSARILDDDGVPVVSAHARSGASAEGD